MRKLISSIIGFFICTSSFAQNVQMDSFGDDSLMIRRLADEILLHSKAYDNLHDLTKNVGGRLSGGNSINTQAATSVCNGSKEKLARNGSKRKPTN